MKIVLIHGQNHKGSSYHIGRLLADQFEGCEISEFFLPRDLDHFCVGCYSCIKNEEKCPFYADKRRIMEIIEISDLLIFTTPTYCMRASAPMKSFLDLTFTYWMSHKPRSCMFSKKAVVISTAAGAGARKVTKDISNALFYWGIPYVRAYGVSVQAINWETVSSKKKTIIRAEIKKTAKAILSKSKVRISIKIKFIFSLMRFMQKKKWGASPSEREYWKRNGWLEDKRPWS